MDQAPKGWKASIVKGKGWFLPIRIQGKKASINNGDEDNVRIVIVISAERATVEFGVKLTLPISSSCKEHP